MFVLPADAVDHDGSEAFVFMQNVNTFERKPVRILLRARRQVVLANDGSLPPGSYVVQSGSAQLNRMVSPAARAGPRRGTTFTPTAVCTKTKTKGNNSPCSTPSSASPSPP